jgi:hypothetical protein
MPFGFPSETAFGFAGILKKGRHLQALARDSVAALNR